MLNLGFTIYQLGSSLNWSSCQKYQPSLCFTFPGSLVLETIPLSLFLLTHTTPHLNLWFCRLALQFLWPPNSVTILPVITLESFTSFCYACLRNCPMLSTASLGTMPCVQGGLVQIAFRSEIIAQSQLLPEKEYLWQLVMLRYINLRVQ